MVPTVKFCTFKEVDLYAFNGHVWSFKVFKNLECLVIQRKNIKRDWATLIRNIVLIPSVLFSKLVVYTENLDSGQLNQLCCALKKMKQEVRVEVRCDSYSV